MFTFYLAHIDGIPRVISASSSVHSMSDLKHVFKKIYLEVGYSHCCDHAKHNQEHPSDNRLWDGDEDRPKLAEDSQYDH